MQETAIDERRTRMDEPGRKHDDDSIPTFAYSPPAWREKLVLRFPGRKFIFLSHRISYDQFCGKFEKRILEDPRTEFFLWGFQGSPRILDFISQHNIRCNYVEDGFIHSIGPATAESPPLSLLVDTRTPHYDATKASDLECLLNEYDFAGEPQLLERADKFMQSVLEAGLSKFNCTVPVDVSWVYGPKKKRRVLVLGEAIKSASKESAGKDLHGNDSLVRLAAEENPDAQIIFKPHPFSLLKDDLRPAISSEALKLCFLLEQPISIADALETIDHVYTMNSLAGFEALMRGIKVTTTGCPFYAGWGLTDDRQPNERRGRRLTVRELFAGAYLLYAKYYDAENKETTPEGFLERTLELWELKRKALKDSSNISRGSDSFTGNAVTRKIHSEADERSEDVEIPTFMIGAPPWKDHLTSWFPERRFAFLAPHISVEGLGIQVRKWNLSKSEVEIFIWGNQINQEVLDFLKESRSKITYVEDGFIRSIGFPGAETPPFSLTMDCRAHHFNAAETSDLEHLLNTFDFGKDAGLLDRADMLMKRMLDSGLSKYNHASRIEDIQEIYGPKKQRRVLVLGELEDGASVKAGSTRAYTNNDIIAIAAMENPDAQIIFMPYPKAMGKSKRDLSNLGPVKHLCSILEQDIPISQALETVDHIYTITSLAGFEALMRGIKATVFGCPFYSGWGLTDDRQPCARRMRKLTLRELFAAAYVLYPKYYDPIYKTACSPEQAIDRLIQMQRLVTPPADPKLGSPSSRKKHIGFDRMSVSGKVVEIMKQPADAKKIESLIELLETCDFPEVWQALGKVNLDADQPAEAVAAFTKAIEKDEADHTNYCLRARARMRAGEFSESTESDFLTALELSGHNDLSLYHDYFRYKWESGPLTDETLSLYQKVVSKARARLKNKKTKAKAQIPNEFFLTYAAMLTQVGMYSRAKSVYDSFKGKENLSHYLSLSNVLSKYPEMKISKEIREVYRHLVENQHRFSDLVHKANGEVAIVGNAPTEFGTGNGRDIDKKKIVVRFNTYDTHFPYSEDYGTKTSIWVRMPPDPYVKTVPRPQLELIMITGSNRLHRPYSEWGWFYQQIVSGEKLQLFPAGPFFELISELGSIPTSGLFLAYLLYKEIGPLSEEHCFGLSFTRDDSSNSAYHFSDSVASWSHRHSQQKEREFFKTISASTGRVYYTPILAAKEVGAGNWVNGVDPQSLSSHYENVLTGRMPASAGQVLWDLNTFNNEISRVISVSPGLHGYSLFGREVEVMSRSESSRISSSDGTSAAELVDRPDSILEGARDFSTVMILGFALGPTGVLGKAVAQKLRARYMCVEYGLISSMALPSEKQFNFSLIVDDKGVFYDSTTESRLQWLIKNDASLKEPHNIERASKLIKQIVANNITKYNKFKSIQLPPRKSKRRILVIDQTARDLSIQYGRCEKYSFQDMLDHALSQQDAEVLLKLHPETVAGAKDSNFKLEDLKMIQGLVLIDEQCNIMSLIKQVDEVYVMTSGVGFEAIMAGVEVRCFGIPFYSGWGLTRDMHPDAFKGRQATIEEVFGAVFFRCTQFYHPVRRDPCSMEEVIDWLCSNSSASSTNSYKNTTHAANIIEEKKNRLGLAVIPRMQEWASQIQHIFPDHKLHFLNSSELTAFDRDVVSSCDNMDIITWGYKGRKAMAVARDLKPDARIMYLEDGFVRSIGLGRSGANPASICADTRGLYFDSNVETDLEKILSSFAFRNEKDLLDMARTAIDKLISLSISKYNHVEAMNIEQIYGYKAKKRVLVVGQCEDDASIKYGCAAHVDNNMLVRLAYEENKDAQIIYKPHPDVLGGLRPSLSNPDDVRDIAMVLDFPLSIGDAFKTIDHVYTITSLSGFEAILRGIQVTTFGCPFYSGWGLTEDRQPNARRNRRLEVEELFAGAYILYSKYFDPVTGAPSSLLDVIDKLAQIRAQSC